MFSLVLSVLATTVCAFNVVEDCKMGELTGWTCIMATLSGINLGLVIYWIDKLFI